MEKDTGRNSSNSIVLSKLEEKDFSLFKSWITDPDELFQFAGPIFTFPVTDDQLEKYIHDNRRVSFKVILAASDEMIGHCELNFENPLPRLSRILIGHKEHRGKGLGKIIVHEMLKKLFLENSYEKADLNVYDWNIHAIRCYEGIGFKVNNGVVSRQNNNGKIWTALNMVITRESWMMRKTNIE